MRSFFFIFFLCWKSQRRYTRAWSVFQSVLCTVYLYKVPWSQTRETNEWSMSMILVTFLKFSFVWALKSAAKQLRLCIALSLSLAFQWPPLVFFFLALTLKPRRLPFLSSVLERQQSQLPLGCRSWLGGLAQAEWLTGNVVFFFVGQLWEGSSFIY